jgi:hypothetical protein
MEDAAAWRVSNLDSQDTTHYEFNFQGAGPTYGSGGSLHAWATVAQSTNIAFWQPVMLTGGDQYEVKGGFVDMQGTIANFWCEILYDVTEPPEHADIGGTTIVGFNTWNGTPPGVDGTFQDNYVKGEGPVFTAPGEAGVPDTVYFVLNIGVWAGGVTRDFEVGVDELSLTPLGGSGIDEHSNGLVPHFNLGQNYPNPFNSQTTISYVLPEASTVTLKVYDLLGREIATLLDHFNQTAGNQKVSFDAAKLPSGVYLYQLQTERYTETKKMMLIR